MKDLVTRYVTTWWATEGPVRVVGYYSDGGCFWFQYGERRASCSAKRAHETWEAAVDDCYEQRDEKIVRLRKQIDKLHVMEFPFDEPEGSEDR